jgi:hypothetical protein
LWRRSGRSFVPIHKAVCIRPVFHAYLVYPFTHKWSTKSSFPRMFGQHLRINGLRITCNVLIRKKM